MPTSKGFNNVYRLRAVLNLKDPAFGVRGDAATDDAAAFNSLVDAAPSNAMILGDPGATYLIGATGLLVDTKTGLKLRGQGAKIKHSALPTQSVPTFGATDIWLKGCTGVEFSDFEVDGNSLASNGVGLTSCTECEVSKVDIYNCGQNAHIFSLSGTRNRYTDNVVTGGVGAARGIWIGNTNSDDENDPLVRGNRVRECPATAIGGTVSGGILTENHCDNCAGSAFALGAVASPNHFRRTVISNNQCRGMSFHGIQSDASGDSFYSENMLITGNICEENDGSGIYAVRMRDSVISNNICRDNNVDASGSGRGIQIDQAKRLMVSGNLCHDTRSGASRTQTDGISVTAQVGPLDVEDIALIGNMCRNNLHTGIAVQNASPGTMAGVTVNGNYCVDNGVNGINIVDAATGDITEVTVVGNHCMGNGTSDLRVDPPDAVIYGNRYELSPAGTLGPFTFTDADTTPSVKGRRWFRCANTGATTITTFDDGVRDQEITILFTNANTTVAETGNIKLSAAFTSSADDILTLIFDGVSWYEKARSVN